MNSTPNPPEDNTPPGDSKGKPQESVTLPANGTTATAEELRVRLVLALDGQGVRVRIDERPAKWRTPVRRCCSCWWPRRPRRAARAAR